MYSKYLYFIVKFVTLLIPNWFGFVKKFNKKEESVGTDKFKVNFIQNFIVLSKLKKLHMITTFLLQCDVYFFL